MTTADVTRTVAPHAAQELRRRVHLLLEEEYLRLRATERPELWRTSSASTDDGVDPAVVVGELDVVDRRVAALERHFSALASDPSVPDGAVFLLDLGDGPQLMLVSDVAVADDQVVAADSPLGIALRDVVPGQVVAYERPPGIGQVRVLAVEADSGVQTPSRTAIAWSAQEAGRRARPMRVLHPRQKRRDPLPQSDDHLTEGSRLSAARATVVVPPRPEPKLHARVVVGLRESHHCADALAVGFAEADRRRAELQVVLIRDGGADDAPGDDLDPVFHAPDEVDVEEAGHLPRAVDEAGRAFPQVEATALVRTGHFAEVLVELSHSADLVVLGMGERPAGIGRKDLLIASHSTCPVIVVRESLIRGGI